MISAISLVIAVIILYKERCILTILIVKITLCIYSCHVIHGGCFGKKLFTRHSFSISLTDEGMLLRDRAEDLIAMADRIEQEFITLDDISGGDIYLGLAESYQIRHLAKEIRKLKNRYPGFTYHITSGDTEQVTENKVKDLTGQPLFCSEQSWNEENGLVFRPLSPKQISELYLIWNKYPSFTPIAERFLAQIQESFCLADNKYR